MTNRKAIRRARRIRRTVLTVCLMALVAVISIGGTIAWLTSTTGSIENTFTVGDINIQLTETTPETKTNIQIVPGKNIPKNPTVVVEANSEDCWLFVMVEEKNWPTSDVTYGIAEPWREVEADDLPNADTKLYYCEVSKTDQATNRQILVDNQVVVANTLDADEMEAIETNVNGKPSLKFKAVAVQKDQLTTVDAAWDAVPETAKVFD